MTIIGLGGLGYFLLLREIWMRIMMDIILIVRIILDHQGQIIFLVRDLAAISKVED